MRMTTYCNCCGAEMGAVDVRERHDPFHHPHKESTYDTDDWRGVHSSPPGEFALVMDGLLYCKGCDAYPGTTIVLSQVDEITIEGGVR
jgi:hypothetical protein